MDTLLLDRTTWDVLLDAKGNIAVASDPYSVEQDVASAIRLFIGECWYDTTRGVPHFEVILGHLPPLGVLKATLVRAALTVPGVTDAVAYISSVKGRQVTGQVQCTTTVGKTFTIGGSFGTITPL